MKPIRLLAIFILASLFAAPCFPATAEFMFRAKIEGKTFEGQPLHWNSDQMLLLGRDGWLREFDPKLAKEAVKTSPSFVPYSAAEMKAMLQQEFDSNCEITTTRHYLVVHPRGIGNEWPDRFEELYNRFGHYFRVRGFALQEPLYPLVAIVDRNRDEYFRRAAASGTPVPPNNLGHYDSYSNRVFLFDETAMNPRANWSDNASTIIHEATHQTAFNSGVHSRFAVPPRWVAEGLATMFEAPGVWSARYDHTQADRVNQRRFDRFRKYVANRRQPGSLAMLLATDEAFRSDSDGAYAEGWALSFYLCETQPRQYAAYLEKTAARAPFSDYSGSERMADFQAIFGSDLKLFESKYLHYMQHDVASPAPTSTAGLHRKR
jgi:hypothetical protein